VLAVISIANSAKVLRAVQNCGDGGLSGRLKLAARIGALLRSGDSTKVRAYQREGVVKIRNDLFVVFVSERVETRKDAT
jgi:hypothetical protein